MVHAVGPTLLVARLAARGIEFEPLNERTTGALAQVLLQRGRAGAARDVVQRLLDDLAELGVEPDPGTLDLSSLVDRSAVTPLRP